jgi:hypothetical protein
MENKKKSGALSLGAPRRCSQNLPRSVGRQARNRKSKLLLFGLHLWRYTLAWFLFADVR